ncbi:MAG TPA: hypothetical protein VMX54_00960 [Vicinamibacteria bacterium]|nr:hypothetical protein [Vicinamibacteria bacterium]
MAWASVVVFAASAGLAVAASPQSKKVDFPETVSWAGKILPGGKHTISWQGDPGNLDVKILDGNKVLAEGKGRLETSGRKYDDDALVTHAAASGMPSLAGIELGGKTTELVLTQS